MLSSKPGRLNGTYRIAALSLVSVLVAGLFIAGWNRHRKLETTVASAVNSQLASMESQSRAAAIFGNLPLSFEPNRGQTDPEVKFLSRSSRYNLFLTASEAVFTLPIHSSDTPVSASPLAKTGKLKVNPQAVLRMEMLGANKTPAVGGDTLLDGHANYLIGRDQSKWTRNVPRYAH